MNNDSSINNSINNNNKDINNKRRLLRGSYDNR